jgi:hypothetical protein
MKLRSECIVATHRQFPVQQICAKHPYTGCSEFRAYVLHYMNIVMEWLLVEF